MCLIIGFSFRVSIIMSNASFYLVFGVYGLLRKNGDRKRGFWDPLMKISTKCSLFYRNARFCLRREMSSS
jgi:hypothetical protein